jgi:hypothetical protein
VKDGGVESGDMTRTSASAGAAMAARVTVASADMHMAVQG